MLKNLKFSTEEYVLGGVAAFILAILLMGSCGGGGAKTPEELGKKVFEAVQHDDMAGALKYSVTQGDLIYMVEKSDLAPAEREKAKQEIKERGSKLKEDLQEAWGITMNQFKAQNWNLTEMEMGEVKADLETKNKVELGTIAVEISEGEKHDKLLLRAFKHSGWKFIPPAMLIGGH